MPRSFHQSRNIIHPPTSFDTSLEFFSSTYYSLPVSPLLAPYPTPTETVTRQSTLYLGKQLTTLGSKYEKTTLLDRYP